ncbi:hypothetical protein LCGC14_1103580 [marine sediment metagenome]|uniref:Uncharacterized protein n=1 Tax=marine sediment metagenome TaxID=412755 RepID=A0A0F9PS09_9ZZZZ
MTTVSEIYPPRWLRATMLADKHPRVVIESVCIEQLYNPRNRKPEPRIVISFHNKTLRLICNKTQAQAIATITGTEVIEEWRGHEIVLAAGVAPNNMATIILSPLPDPPPVPAAAAAEQEEPAHETEADAAHAGEPSGEPSGPSPEDNPFD